MTRRRARLWASTTILAFGCAADRQEDMAGTGGGLTDGSDAGSDGTDDGTDATGDPGTGAGDTAGSDDGAPPPKDYSECKWSAHQGGDTNHPLHKSSSELYVPSDYDPAIPTPLVVALHGTLGTGNHYLGAYCQWRDTAERNGYIVVAPNSWNDNAQFLYGCCGEPCTDFCQDDGEEDFMWAMISEIDDCYNVDPQRLYMYGFSQGGFFSSWFCLKHEDKLAGCGIQGAGCYSPGDSGHCNRRAMGDQEHKVPMYLYTGTADQYSEGAQDFARLLEGHGYPHEIQSPAGWPHECQPSAAQMQWDWWQAQGPLGG